MCIAARFIDHETLRGIFNHPMTSALAARGFPPAASAARPDYALNNGVWS